MGVTRRSRVKSYKVLDTLITSKTRLRLLLKFFLNPETRAYLRGLGDEFGESTNSIRLELNRLEDASMLKGEYEGNKKFYTVNLKHPLYTEMSSIVRKYMGLDVIVDQVVEKLGGVDSVFLTGDLAEGKDTNVLDVVFIGKELNKSFLVKLVDKAEDLLSKKIKYLVYSTDNEFDQDFSAKPRVLLWANGA